MGQIVESVEVVVADVEVSDSMLVEMRLLDGQYVVELSVVQARELASMLAATADEAEEEQRASIDIPDLLDADRVGLESRLRAEDQALPVSGTRFAEEVTP